MPKRPATSASWSQPKAGTTRALHQHQHQCWGRRTDAVRTKNWTNTDVLFASQAWVTTIKGLAPSTRPTG
ncbi:hypothetical protein LA080_013960 [Diaporthe eres]|nr:hypothetical protein LA080_013960 [Diaporthe eres]